MSRATELLEQATPLPWRIGAVSDDSDEPGWFDTNGATLSGISKADGALIAYAVNRLPDYEAAVEALATLIDRWHSEPVRPPGDAAYSEWMNQEWSPALRGARAALARLREGEAAHV